MKSIPFADDTR